MSAKDIYEAEKSSIAPYNRAEGHASGEPPPPHEPSPVRKWFRGYIDALFQIGLFGGSITFTVLVTDIAQPRENSNFSPETIRTFLSLAWLCFSWALGVSILVKVIYFGELWDRFRERRQRSGQQVGKAFLVRVKILRVLIVLFLSSLPPVAFMFMSLAVSAYVAWIGWFVFGWSAFYYVLVLCLCSYGINLNLM